MIVYFPGYALFHQTMFFVNLGNITNNNSLIYKIFKVGIFVPWFISKNIFKV
jgi:hypothetical protein